MFHQYMERVKVHNYLGMDLNFSWKGSVKVSKIKYVKKIIDACQEEIKSTSTFPETDHLIKTREESDAMVLP